MIFVASTLRINGGTTFLLRLARAYCQQAMRMHILVLDRKADPGVLAELGEIADLRFLDEFLHPWVKRFALSQVSVFFPFDREKLRNYLYLGGGCVHVMGCFGLLLAYRFGVIHRFLKITAGIYHQNEFSFKSGRYFNKELQYLFGKLPAENLVFFNEFTRAGYSRFFDKDYSTSTLLPIGISIDFRNAPRKFYSIGKIVSVGNLENFKTYNRHVIEIIAKLASANCPVYYEIYGDGEERESLQNLISELNIGDRIKIRGRIPYGRFAEVVRDAMVFVGSGTAILEASSLGVPSIVGIESIETPDTYGFLFEIPGFTYNEKMNDVPLRSIEGAIRQLLSASGAEVLDVGAQCAKKAQEFSVDRTASGFIALEEKVSPLRIPSNFWYWMFLLCSFLWMALLDRFSLDSSFRRRREQGSL